MKAVLACLAALGILNAVVLGVRVESLHHVWRYMITEGGEGPGVYAIWKAVHGYPVYEWPHRMPFALAQYNALFYHGYAAVFRAVGVDAQGILLWGRVLTAAFGLLGLTCSAWLLWKLLPKGARDGASCLVIAVLTGVLWFGTNLTSWWALSIRPDIPAAAFAVMGLAGAAYALRLNSMRMLGVAGVSFSAAWSFKQSAVLTLGGVVLYLAAARRSAREVLALLVPFGIVVALALVLGGQEYRFSLLKAPGVGAFWPRQSVEILSRVFLQNAFVWLFPVLLLVWREAASTVREAATSDPHLSALLYTIAGIALTGGLVLTAHEGANKNHFLEAYLVCGLIATRGLLLLRTGTTSLSNRAAAAATVLLIPMTAFPAVQLAWPNRFGVTLLGTGGILEHKAALAERMERLPKPLLVNDDVLAQPWHSTGGQYPTVVIDNVWTGMARRSGLISGEGAGEALLSRTIQSAVLRTDDPLLGSAERAGFRCIALPDCPRCDPSLRLCRR